MLTLILCGISILVFLYFKYKDDTKYKDFYKVKGPKPLPIIGNVLLFAKNPKEIFETQSQLVKEFGYIYRLQMGWQKIVVTGKAEHLEIILGSTKHLKKSANYDFFKNWLGDGLINSTGDIWKRHRKLITPTFHFNNLQDYSKFIEKNLSVFLEMLETKTNKAIDLNTYMKLYALDTICDSAMRYELNAQIDSNSEYVKALEGYLEVHMIRFFSLFYRPRLIFANSKLGKHQNECTRRMKRFTQEVIASRKVEKIENKKSSSTSTNSENELDEFQRPKRCFLDLLLDKQDEDNLLTDVEIQDEVNSFMFAGHDTVSSAINFCLYELAKHPELQEALVEESYNVMPKGKKIEVNCSNISSLKYLDRVVKESMRLYTTVPFVERELGEDVVLDDLRIPAGTTVQIMMYSMHRNEKYYPEPEKFDPDRFSSENSKGKNPYTYIPFSAGPRNCIGYKYGLLMTKATVINILRNFKVKPSLATKHGIELVNLAILQSETGIHIILEKRNN